MDPLTPRPHSSCLPDWHPTVSDLSAAANLLKEIDRLWKGPWGVVDAADAEVGLPISTDRGRYRVRLVVNTSA